jgi:hypothetical protein
MATRLSIEEMFERLWRVTQGVRRVTVWSGVSLFQCGESHVSKHAPSSSTTAAAATTTTTTTAVTTAAS